MPDGPRLILADSEPQTVDGFRLAKSGKCWWTKADGIAQARAIAAKLVAEGVHGKIVRAIDRPRPYSRNR